MPYHATKSIEVGLWGRPVGALVFDASSGAYAFEYLESFKRSGLEPAPLTVPTTLQGAASFPHLPRETYFGLPAFIADSLPDAFGNALIDRWMATQGIRKEAISPLDRLAYLGNRGIGALEFKPALKTGDTRPSALEMGELIETARKALHFELRDGNDPVLREEGTDEDAADKTELQGLIAVGTSAGGARAKAVVGYNGQADTFVSGQFDLPSGFEHWLIKFDVESVRSVGGPSDYGRIEFAYYLMACACGIEMSPSRLYEADGRAHFMTRRFDRVNDTSAHSTSKTKLHQQTLCGLAELDFRQREAHDYNQLFMVVEDLGLGYDAIDQIFLRMVFNICLANNDDHTKNHSFLMDPEGIWRLSPAYDLTHAYREDSIWVSRHLMSVNGRFENIARKDVLQVAQRFQVASAQKHIDAILEIARHWPDFARQAGVSQDSTRRIAADIARFSDLLVL